MGRKPTGWQLRQKNGPGTTYTVRFWINGREYERSTATSEASGAAREASRIYAQEVGRAATAKPKRRAGAQFSLEELIAQWALSLESTHDAGTIKTWELYANVHWLTHFGELHHVNEAMCVEYRNARLRVVQGSTVRKELTALRQFIGWCVLNGHLPETVKVHGVSTRSLGTTYEVARRKSAITLSPDECERIIALLPEWSTSRKVKPFPIRARFRVAYETGLRPSTIDKLEVGVHYRPGNSTITLTGDADKNRFGRELPLSKRAREALDAVCPDKGLIFGRHFYEEHIHAAAITVLGEERAEQFCPAHLRSARITHWLEATANLAGTQYLAGHKQATTTAKYARPSFRAAQDVLRATQQAPRLTKKQAV